MKYKSRADLLIAAGNSIKMQEAAEFDSQWYKPYAEACRKALEESK